MSQKNGALLFQSTVDIHFQNSLKAHKNCKGSHSVRLYFLGPGRLSFHLCPTSLQWPTNYRHTSSTLSRACDQKGGAI